MKQQLSDLINAAIEQLQQEGELAPDLNYVPLIERTRDASFGSYSCNVAMALAKAANINPRELAAKITAVIPHSPLVSKTEIAGPGFINFFLHEHARFAVITEILRSGSNYARSNVGGGQRINLEFVSANPNGPLHIGHGRGAAYGDCVGNLLEAVGFHVHREYYVNDAGRQMNILAVSVWLRYLEACGHHVTFPQNGYKGEYVKDIAKALKHRDGDLYLHPYSSITHNVPADEGVEGGDKDAHIDAMIANLRELLGAENFASLHKFGLQSVLKDIKEDLEAFGVVHDEWYSEASLVNKGAIPAVIERLRKAGFVYEKDGATWFQSTAFDDEKDRVLIKANGDHTYLVPDIAYHIDKFDRGASRIIDILGSDHHGYVPRLRAAMQAMGKTAAQIEARLVQFATLYRGTERVQMSTRSGSFVTLRELREEVGKDATRFFYIMRKADQHLDFDLELAKSQSNENPVYYVQYAHARVSSVLRQLAERNLSHNPIQGDEHLNLLITPHEDAIVRRLEDYTELLRGAALDLEPHRLAQYLRDLATDFHSYYNAVSFLVEDELLRNARLSLILAVQQILANGLRLLGVSAPESM